MRKFRKIDPRMHNDEKYMALSLRGQKLFDYLLTHPNMTALGAMRATDYGICLELVNANTPNEFDRMIDEAFGKAFGKAFPKLEAYLFDFRLAQELGLIQYDPEKNCLALPNFLKYNPPTSINTVKAWNDALDLIPDCDLKLQVIEKAKELLKGYDVKFQEAFMPKALPKPLPKPLPNPLPNPLASPLVSPQGEGEGEGVNLPTPPYPPEGGKDEKPEKKGSPPVGKPLYFQGTNFDFTEAQAARIKSLNPGIYDDWFRLFLADMDMKLDDPKYTGYARGKDGKLTRPSQVVLNWLKFVREIPSPAQLAQGGFNGNRQGDRGDTGRYPGRGTGTILGPAQAGTGSTGSKWDKCPRKVVGGDGAEKEVPGPGPLPAVQTGSN